MAFDIGFNFRGTAEYVTDPAYAAWGQHQMYPYTFTNGNGLSINAGRSVGYADASDAASGNDPRIAGWLRAQTTHPEDWRADLSSGSAPGAGDYTVDIAAGRADAGANWADFILKDGATTKIDGTNGGAGYNLGAGGKYIDASLATVTASTSWTGTPASVTFAGTIVNLSMAPSNTGQDTRIAHFRLTKQEAGGGPGTTYYARAYVHGPDGYVYGGEISFKLHLVAVVTGEIAGQSGLLGSGKAVLMPPSLIAGQVAISAAVKYLPWPGSTVPASGGVVSGIKQVAAPVASLTGQSGVSGLVVAIGSPLTAVVGQSAVVAQVTYQPAGSSFYGNIPEQSGVAATRSFTVVIAGAVAAQSGVPATYSKSAVRTIAGNVPGQSGIAGTFSKQAVRTVAGEVAAQSGVPATYSKSAVLTVAGAIPGQSSVAGIFSKSAIRTIAGQVDAQSGIVATYFKPGAFLFSGEVVAQSGVLASRAVLAVVAGSVAAQSGVLATHSKTTPSAFAGDIAGQSGIAATFSKQAIRTVAGSVPGQSGIAATYSKSAIRSIEGVVAAQSGVLAHASGIIKPVPSLALHSGIVATWRGPLLRASFAGQIDAHAVVQSRNRKTVPGKGGGASGFRQVKITGRNARSYRPRSVIRKRRLAVSASVVFAPRWVVVSPRSFPTADAVIRYFWGSIPMRRAREDWQDQPRVPAGDPEGGQWTDSGSGDATVYQTTADVEQYDDWGQKGWKWKGTGSLLPGRPITKGDLPNVVFHVTTALSSVRASGGLLGQKDAGGMGGGQNLGVSLTTSISDARLMRRELKRVAQISRGEADWSTIEGWAAQDARIAKLPKGRNMGAVAAARMFYEANVEHATRGKTRLMVEAYTTSYLNARQGPKNPIIFSSSYEHLRNVADKDIAIVQVPVKNIPDRALIIQGSDKFLHEVRVSSNIPIRTARTIEGESVAVHYFVSDLDREEEEILEWLS